MRSVLNVYVNEGAGLRAMRRHTELEYEKMWRIVL